MRHPASGGGGVAEGGSGTAERKQKGYFLLLPWENSSGAPWCHRGAGTVAQLEKAVEA